MATDRRPQTLRELLSWLAAAPPGTALDAAALCSLLAEMADTPEREPEPVGEAGSWRPTWRERLWTAPAETRIGRAELLEAVGRPPSWLYRHTGAKAAHRIPHRKIDRELTFLVGEVRAWLREREEMVEAGPMDIRRDLRAV